MDLRHLYRDKNKLIKWLGGYTEAEYQKAIWEERRIKFVWDEYRYNRVPIEVQRTVEIQYPEWTELAKKEMAKEIGEYMMEKNLIEFEVIPIRDQTFNPRQLFIPTVKIRAIANVLGFEKRDIWKP